VTRFKGVVLGLACLALTATALHAQGSYAATDRFGYSGTIWRYTTLADLLAGTNAVSGSPFTVPARDLGLYMVAGNAAFGGPTYANAALFLSNWYANGGDTPSDQNTGFIQMYDVEGGSVTSMNGAWLNLARTMYGFSLTGGNTVFGGCLDGSGDCGRLWNAGSSLGSGETTAGVFYSYVLNFTASGLTSATWNGLTGVYESASDPTAVFGSLAGIFQNTSTEDPSSNGWFKYDLALSMDNWAYSHGYTEPGVFGSATVSPEPATLVLLGTGLIGILGLGARRRRRST
jgi:hypothetical protein